MKITGKYDDKKIPDSGLKLIKYDLNGIGHDAVSMPSVLNEKKDEIILILKNDPFQFKVEIESAGVPDTKENANKVKEQIPAPGEWVASGDTVVLKVFDDFEKEESESGEISSNKVSQRLKKIENHINEAHALSKDAQTKCSQANNAALNLFQKMTADERELALLESTLNKFLETAEKSDAVKNKHKIMEKKAAAVAKITHELEKLSLKMCETTKGLNDYQVEEAEHDRNYDWITSRQEKLKELFGLADGMVKDGVQLLKESKKQDEKDKIFEKEIKNKIDEGVNREIALAANYKKLLANITMKAKPGGVRQSQCSSQNIGGSLFAVLNTLVAVLLM